MLYHVTSWCDLFLYQPDPEDFCEEQWLMAKLIHLLKADVADQQFLVGILFPKNLPFFTDTSYTSNF